MKSIREWRTEREGVSPQKLLEFNLMTSLRNFAGGSTVKQDSQIRSGLRSKILSLWKDAQASGMTPLDFVRQVWAVAGSAVTGRMGGNLNVANTAKGLSAPDSQQVEWNRFSELVLKEMEGEMGAQPAGGDYEINKAKFAQFANSSTLDVDSKLRSLLRAKIDDIRKMDKYQNMSSAEFFQKVVAAVAAIETDTTSSTASVGSLADKLNKPNEGLVG
jgi:hypothetical protein